MQELCARRGRRHDFPRLRRACDAALLGSASPDIAPERFPSEDHALAYWINAYNAFDAASPFGGYKQSGFGRDLGAEALEQYTNVKSVWVAL